MHLSVCTVNLSTACMDIEVHGLSALTRVRVYYFRWQDFRFFEKWGHVELHSIQFFLVGI